MSSGLGLAGRAALVTGASRGIGLAVAEALAAAGAGVCVTARDAHGLDAAVRRLREAGGGGGGASGGGGRGWRGDGVPGGGGSGERGDGASGGGGSGVPGSHGGSDRGDQGDQGDRGAQGYRDDRDGDAPGGRVIGCAGDVADPAHLTDCVDRTLNELGRLDILVNNAAANTPFGPLVDIDPDGWRDAFAVNVEAPLWLVQAAWQRWMREHGGTVVNICSEGAHGVGPNIGVYGTGKAALLHLTRQLAGELAPTVRVNSVSPGLVRTEMARFVWEEAEEQIAAGLPMGCIGEPEDVARAVLWLVSDEARWVTGADLVVDGGTRVRGARPAPGGGPYPIHDRLRAHGTQ